MKIFKKLSCMLIFCIMCLSSNVFANKALNIVFVGECVHVGSGKTELVLAIIGRRLNYRERIGIYSEDLSFFNKSLKCYLYDTPGASCLQEEIVRKLDNADIIVITIDSSDNENEFDGIIKKQLSAINQVYPRLPILLVATKIDNASEDIDKLYRNFEKLRVAYADTCDFEWVATSAKERINLGSLTDSEDLGNNFWGKIRYIIKQRNMYDLLREDAGEENFFNDIRKPRNESCILV